MKVKHRQGIFKIIKVFLTLNLFYRLTPRKSWTKESFSREKNRGTKTKSLAHNQCHLIISDTKLV